MEDKLPEIWQTLIDNGVLGGILFAVGLGLWKLFNRALALLFDEQKGLVVAWIREQKENQKARDAELSAFLAGMTRHSETQQSLCGNHATAIATLAENSTQSAADLRRLVEIHEDEERLPASIQTVSLGDLARVEILKLRSRREVTDDDRRKMIELLEKIIDRET